MPCEFRCPKDMKQNFLRIPLNRRLTYGNRNIVLFSVCFSQKVTKFAVYHFLSFSFQFFAHSRFITKPSVLNIKRGSNYLSEISVHFALTNDIRPSKFKSFVTYQNLQFIFNGCFVDICLSSLNCLLTEPNGEMNEYLRKYSVTRGSSFNNKNKTMWHFGPVWR